MIAATPRTTSGCSSRPGAALPDAPVRVGITSVAAAALGELVFVDLPEVGSTIVVGEILR